MGRSYHKRPPGAAPGPAATPPSATRADPAGRRTRRLAERLAAYGIKLDLDVYTEVQDKIIDGDVTEICFSAAPKHYVVTRLVYAVPVRDTLVAVVVLRYKFHGPAPLPPHNHNDHDRRHDRRPKVRTFLPPDRLGAALDVVARAREAGKRINQIVAVLP